MSTMISIEPFCIMIIMVHLIFKFQFTVLQINFEPLVLYNLFNWNDIWLCQAHLLNCLETEGVNAQLLCWQLILVLQCLLLFGVHSSYGLYYSYLNFIALYFSFDLLMKS